MIKSLKINQKEKRLEYAVENGEVICDGEGHCYPIEKIEVFKIMKVVIKNWNQNNEGLQL